MTDDHSPDRPAALAPEVAQPALSYSGSLVEDPDASIPQAKSGALRNLAITTVLVLMAVQVVLLVTMLDTRNDLSALRSEIAAVESVTPTDLGAGQSSPGPSLPAATGNLPRFVGGAADAAVGRNIGDLTGLEYYSGATTRLSIADGKSRAYMVWAHWCPYCQQELPVIADWVTSSADELGHFEVVSVTTAMDDNAANPLVPYLDENRFPFPVIVDEDGSLTRKLGVNAFPFWVFVAPDGTVVGRAAGFIEADALADVFGQLNDMAAGEPSALPAPD